MYKAKLVMTDYQLRRLLNIPDDVRIENIYLSDLPDRTGESEICMVFNCPIGHPGFHEYANGTQMIIHRYQSYEQELFE